jgi:hypothetical protein
VGAHTIVVVVVVAGLYRTETLVEMGTTHAKGILAAHTIVVVAGACGTQVWRRGWLTLVLRVVRRRRRLRCEGRTS